MMTERILTDVEKAEYVNAVSNEIFGKPFVQLNENEQITLRVNLLCRCNHGEMSEKEYVALKATF
jgi:hypothetical protein